MVPNKQAFKRVCEQLEAGEALTFRMVGEVFGPEFWEMVVFSYMDANDAARAVQGAIARLREGEIIEDEQ